MWILPTLSRPRQCAEVLQRIKQIGCSSSGIVFVNGPEHAHEYLFELEGNLLDNWRVIYHPENIGALGALNFVFTAYPDESFYGFIGDDEFLGEGVPSDWDNRLIHTAGDWGISHGYDNIHHGSRAQGYLCIGGKLARAVGYLAIPECWHWYGLDDMWEAMIRSKLCFAPCLFEIKIEHHHPAAGGESDACYDLGQSKKHIDQQIFFHWMRTQLPTVAERVKQARNLGRSHTAWSPQ